MNHVASIFKACLTVLLLAGLAVGLTTMLSNAPLSLQNGSPLSPIQTPTPFTEVPTPVVTAVPHETFQDPASTPLLTPETRTPTGTPPTTTPFPGEIRLSEQFTPAPSPTPMPVTNLAESLPNEDKVVFIVRRSDGTYEQYLLPFYVSDEEEIRQLLNMGPQDVIVSIHALVPLPPSTPVLTKPEALTGTSFPFVTPLPTPMQTPLP